MKILHFPQVKSTMDEARRAIEGGHIPPFLLLADRQTEGRGRLEGRRWESGPGASLAMTLCLDPSISLSPALPLRVGLGVAQRLCGLEGLSRRIALKWPNDILGLGTAEGGWKKLGGILCESSGSGLFIGIGINLKREAYGPRLSEKATSLEELPSEPEQKALLALISGSEEFASTLARAVVESLEDPRWREKYISMLWGLGQEMRFIAGDPRSGGEETGKMLGVEEDGSLVLLENGKGLKRYHSGEISGLLPRQG